LINQPSAGPCVNNLTLQHAVQVLEDLL
jgi:hypothetical protein